MSIFKRCWRAEITVLLLYRGRFVQTGKNNIPMTEKIISFDSRERLLAKTRGYPCPVCRGGKMPVAGPTKKRPVGQQIARLAREMT